MGCPLFGRVVHLRPVVNMPMASSLIIVLYLLPGDFVQAAFAPIPSIQEQVHPLFSEYHPFEMQHLGTPLEFLKYAIMKCMRLLLKFRAIGTFPTQVVAWTSVIRLPIVLITTSFERCATLPVYIFLNIL